MPELNRAWAWLVSDGPVERALVDGDERGEGLVVLVGGVVGLAWLVAGAEGDAVPEPSGRDEGADLAVVALVDLVPQEGVSAAARSPVKVMLRNSVPRKPVQPMSASSCW